MSKNKSEYKKIIVAGLFMIIVLSGAFSFSEYYRINRRINFITAYHNTIAEYQSKIDAVLVKNHSPLKAEDIDFIDTWMTFKYINTIFNLPADYLKNGLNISDTRYPNLTLNGYIRNQKLNKTTFLLNVKNTVASYLANNK